MGDDRVDISEIINRALDNDRKEQLIGQLNRLRNDPDVTGPLDSDSPSVVIVDCSALPVPTRWYPRDTLFFHKPPLLLRPDITTNDNDKRSLYSYILEFAVTELSSVDDSKGIALTMANNHGYDSEEEPLSTGIPGGSMQVESSAWSILQQRQQNVGGINSLTRYMVLKGCLGNGKSHIMCELALRAIVGRPDLRVVYPLDCHEWSKRKTATDSLAYLVDALHIAFVEDDFLEVQLSELDEARGPDIGDAIRSLLYAISPIANKDEQEACFRLVLFVDNYNEASDNVKLIVDELMKQEWIFIVFAARSNRPIDLKENNFVISSSYDRKEAKALISWIVNKPQGPFNFLLDLAVTSRNILNDAKIDEICSLVSEFTWLNPREINELFDASRFSGDWRNFASEANDFVICEGNQRLDDYLNEVLDCDRDALEIYKDRLEEILLRYLNIYFGIPISYSLKGVAELDPDNSKNSPSPVDPFIHYHDSNVFGDYGRLFMNTFSSPRIAHKIFNMTSDLNPKLVKVHTGKADIKILNGGASDSPEFYSTGFIKNHYSYAGSAIASNPARRNNFISKTARLIGSNYTDWDTLKLEISTHMPRRTYKKVFHASASKNQDNEIGQPQMKNVDFIVYDQNNRKFEFFIIGFNIRTVTWDDIHMKILSGNFRDVRPTNHGSNFGQVARICGGFCQALVFQQGIGKDKCRVNVIVSGKTFNEVNHTRRSANFGSLFVSLVNIDGQFSNMLTSVSTNH